MEPEDSGAAVIPHTTVVEVDGGGEVGSVAPLGGAPLDPSRVAVMTGLLQKDNLRRDSERVIAHGVQSVFGKGSNID